MTAILEPLSFEIPKVTSFGMWILRFKIRKKKTPMDTGNLSEMAAPEH